jgi:hypothetical protein
LNNFDSLGSLFWWLTVCVEKQCFSFNLSV